MAKATLLLRRRLEFPDGGLVDVVLWKLPHPSSERPHGFKYRLYYGDGAGNCLVRYDKSGVTATTAISPTTSRSLIFSKA
jgi:hypothetical protein